MIPALSALDYRRLLSAYLAAFVATTWLVRAGRVVVAVLIAMSSLFVARFNGLDNAASSWVYKLRFRERGAVGVAYTRYTPYHKIEVVKLKDGKHMLFLNGQRQFGEGAHYVDNYFLARYPASLLGAPKTLIMGCGSMSTFGLVSTLAPSVKIVDIDPGVFETSRRYFQAFNRIDQQNNWTFEADDAKHFLANSKERFDLILHDIPPARTRQTALTYTEQFFRLTKARLTPRGIFSISSLNSMNPRVLYGKKMLATLTRVFDRFFVIVYQGSAYFYGGGPEMRVPDRAELTEFNRRAGMQEAAILMKDDLERLTAGVRMITINNVGELIFD